MKKGWAFAECNIASLTPMTLSKLDSHLHGNDSLLVEAGLPADGLG